MDTSNKKANVIARTVTAAEDLVNLMNRVRELRQEALDSGFGPGGADTIVEADFTETAPHANLQKFLDVFTVFQALDAALAANNRQHYVRLQLLRR